MQVESKGVNDFVTEVDKHAEAVIVDILLAAYPGHGILAEESGRELGAKDSEFLPDVEEGKLGIQFTEAICYPIRAKHGFHFGYTKNMSNPI